MMPHTDDVLARPRRVLFKALAVGAALLVWAVLEDEQAARQRTEWVRRGCLIESCQLEPETVHPLRPADRHRPRVRYRYEIAGTVHTSDAVSLHEITLHGVAEARAFMQRYGPGMEAECYVNPADPGRAVLILPQHDRAHLLAWLGGGVILLAGVGLGLLKILPLFDTAPLTPRPRAPGWGEPDSGPHDPLRRTRGILRERLEGPPPG